jgi:cysteinyl-tRNA synthetase
MEYTQEKIDEIIKNINEMSQYQMAYIWRFAPSGNIYFDSKLPFFEVFNKRFNELGGMTPEISKSLGWNK